jgi:hypothetical protein
MRHLAFWTTNGSEFRVVHRIDYEDEDDDEWELEQMVTRVTWLEACTDKPAPTQRQCRSYGAGSSEAILSINMALRTDLTLMLAPAKVPLIQK